MSEKNPNNDDSATVVYTGFNSILRLVVAPVASLGMLLTFGWYLSQPRVDEYFGGFVDPLVKVVETLQTSQEDLLKRQEELIGQFEAMTEEFNKPRKMLEVRSTPKLLDPDKVYQPGDTVRIMYWLRRNHPCASNVIAQFIEGITASVDSTLSYEFSAALAPVTQEFFPFPVSIKLPDNISDGWYSYMPVVYPKVGNGCLTSEPVRLMPSEFFKVQSDVD